MITVKKEGEYKVIASNTCGTATDNIYIKIEPCANELFFPSGFSPNSNGMNDDFRALYSGAANFRDFQLKVFNRWGELVFLTNDLSKGWNGTYKGKDQASGIYVWLAQYRQLPAGKLITKKGTLMLIK